MASHRGNLRPLRRRTRRRIRRPTPQPQAILAAAAIMFLRPGIVPRPIHRAAALGAAGDTPRWGSRPQDTRPQRPRTGGRPGHHATADPTLPQAAGPPAPQTAPAVA